ncbi:MAG: hypothetical protein LBU70_03760 [Chitinispirillales bacterium]|jgi:hypothetical protein|nr:hypothetical protein [Chitinispirillales bacterium]
MLIITYPENIDINSTLQAGDMLIAVISFDGTRAIISHIDECMEHHILLSKAGLPSLDIDKYFRIVFDRENADWTFVCPLDYKNITDKTRRITAFYKDGFDTISAFMAKIGLFIGIKIPKRYSRHINEMKENT